MYPVKDLISMKAKLPAGFLAAWITTTVIVVFCANAAFAEGPHHGKGHHGKGMPAFEDVDTNADGVIVADELYAMQAKRMSEQAQDGRKLKHAGDRCVFEDVDTDGDGEVSEEEFAAHNADDIDLGATGVIQILAGKRVS